MSTRKFESNYLKIQEKRIIEAIIASQKRAMNKFLKNRYEKWIRNYNRVKKD